MTPINQGNNLIQVDILAVVKGQRLLAIDYGERFLGVAVSDIMWHLSTPLFPIDSKSCNAFQALGSLIDQHACGGIVVGYPLNMNGSEGAACQKVLEFCEKLRKFFPNIPIGLFDERLSTVAADNAMIEGDLSRKKRKQKVDSLAASYILQNTLDYLRNKVTATIVGTNS